MRKQLQLKYEDIISLENLLDAWKEFKRGKTQKTDVIEFSLHLMDNLIQLHRDLVSLRYSHQGYYAFNISDPEWEELVEAIKNTERIFNTHFIYSSDSNAGVEKIAGKIQSSLLQNKKVLWLIPGGSNIFTAVEIMIKLRSKVSKTQLQNLSITLTDERFGPVGHKDSNWKQLIEADFDFNDIQSTPVLKDLELEETVDIWNKELDELLRHNEVIVGQFGIGADGHIAGMLPNSSAVLDSRLACAYDAEQFTRITLTAMGIQKIHSAFAFAFGESKKDTLTKLRDRNIPIIEQPAQILKELPEARVYSDQFENHLK